MLSIQGSPQADIKAEWVGVVWAGFVTTSILFPSHIKVKLTVKAEWASLLEGAWGEHWV